MQIRRAKETDMDGLNKLLMQVLMVHHNGRPDLFKPNAKKYTDEELTEIIDKVFEEVKPTSVKDMGMIMKNLSPLIKGKADLGFVNTKVKEKLSQL